MSSGTDRARALLTAAKAEAVCSVAGPGGGSNCRGCKFVEADVELKTKSKDLLALAIKQHESLRGEHMQGVYNVPWHLRAVENCDYMGPVNDAGCSKCLVLLQWEQMWEEKKTEVRNG